MSDMTPTSILACVPVGPALMALPPPAPVDISGAHIAHEVNQPLSAILINANVAMFCLTKDHLDLDEARRAIEGIIGNTRRASAVVRSVRDLVREAPPAMASLDINALIEDVLEFMCFDLRRHGIAVEIDLAKALRPVRGDRVRLERVLVNLVTNGIDAMRAVRGRPRRLRIATRREHADVLVAVEDTGTGVDPAHIERIFDPLFTSKADGTGLGLSICRSIVETHGGRLWAAPNLPHGTTFSFVIPAHGRQADADMRRMRSRGTACVTAPSRRARIEFCRADTAAREAGA